MPRKYWFDTCIWRDFYEDRFSRSQEPIGRYAYLAFASVLKRRDVILFSESLVIELKNKFNEVEIESMLGFMLASGTLMRAGVSKEETSEAGKLADERDLPFADCLIAVQARDNNAVVVSRDSHFFQNLADITKTIRPEEIT